MYCEWLEVGQDVVDVVFVCWVCGGWVVVVGIISVCLLESVVCDGELKFFSGDIDIFIYLGWLFYVVDVLVINFYLFEFILLMLVLVFVGYLEIMVVYVVVVVQGYCFFSYGDVMFIICNFVFCGFED